MEAEIYRMCEFGIIVPGESDYTSPLVLVEVPGKDSRPCVDYRRLNKVTLDQTYPIPNTEESRDSGEVHIYLYVRYSVGILAGPTDRASFYATFICPLGTFRPLMLAFSLKNARYCFSNLMDRVLQGLGDFTLPYLDDVAIFSNTRAI